MGLRFLTDGEKAIAFSVFGNSINVDIIQIADHAAPGQTAGTIGAPTGSIFFAPTASGAANPAYRPDFSVIQDDFLKGIFVHELTHVWEAQHGVNVIAEGLADKKKGQEAYNITGVPADVSFHNGLGLEQRAEIVRLWYMTKEGIAPTGSQPFSYYDNILKQSPYFNEDPRPPGQAPTLPGRDCFIAGTSILLADGGHKPIEKIQVGDTVLAFDGDVNAGQGALEPRRVVRTFTNVTDQLIKISAAACVERGPDGRDFGELIVTPGHLFLTKEGHFDKIINIITRADREGVSAELVLSSGKPIAIRAEHFYRDSETERLFGQGEVTFYDSAGAAALAPRVKKGWATYNFEVETLHTYVANEVRVHNQSAAIVALDNDDVADALGHQYNGSDADFKVILDKLALGQLDGNTVYGSDSDADRYAASFDNNPNKIVISGDADSYGVGVVSAGFLQHITAFPANGMRIDTAFAPNGSRLVTTTDLPNFYGWDREIQSIHPDGLTDKIVVNNDGTVGYASWNGAEVAGNIGALFGSKLGTYLGGNSLAAQLSLGTVMGAIGNEVGKALFMSGTFTLETSIQNAFGTLAGGSGVGSLPSGAITSISSLLMSELADALNLHGFEGGLFQTAGTTITAQLITNAYGMMTGATVPVAGGGSVPYTMFTNFDSGAIVGQLEGSVGAYFGSQLAGHVVIPHYAEGAIGQQIGSAVGATLGNAIVPVIGGFVGALIGSIAGSIAGDLAGNDPESHGRVVFYTDGRFHPDPVSFYGDHGANGNLFMNIATYTGNAVNALADFAGVQMNATPVTTPLAISAAGLQLLYTQDNHYFTINEPFQGPLSVVAYPDSDDDLSPLINKGIMTLAHRVALTGGDPLVRLAWANSQADNPTAFSFDLQIAKDYREYLDDKDMINLVMAAEPESAFTAGWVVTLLKAHELGLDAAPTSTDFRNGNDVLTGTAAPELLMGGAGHDVLTALGGDDRLNGGYNDDTMAGGAGNDMYIVDNGYDVVIEYSGEGTDTVITSVSYALAANVENLVLSVGAVNGTGNALNNTITGNAANNSLDGGAGGDTLIGGPGDDIYYVDNGYDVVTENPGEGTDTVYSSVSYGLAANVEYLVLIEGAGAINGTGNALNNWIVGNSANNWAFGQEGDDAYSYNGGFDFFDGGAGNDTLDMSPFGSAVKIGLEIGFLYNAPEVWTRDAHDLNAGIWRALVDTANIENAIGTAWNDEFYGDANANTYFYTGGFDLADGGAGIDTLDFSRFGSAVKVGLNFAADYGGAPEAWTRDAHNLADGIWRAIVDQTGFENVAGSVWNDEIYGDAGANTYFYTGGFDTFDGGAGSDTLDLSRFGSAIVVNIDPVYTAPNASTRDTHDINSGAWRSIVDTTSVENVVGTVWDDLFIGDDNANTYFYTGGFDTFDGRGGTDTLDLSRFGSAMQVDLTVGSAPEVSTRDTHDLNSGLWRSAVDVSNIENVVGTIWDDRFVGDGNANTYVYTGGFDTFDGGAGSDTLDLSRFASAIVVNIDPAYTAPNASTRDTHDINSGAWRSIVDTTSVENVVGTVWNDLFIGDDNANTYFYTGGIDIFDGRGGSDTLDLSRFASAVQVDLTVDWAYEAWTRDTHDLNSGLWRSAVDVAGVENLIGSVWDDRFVGDANANTLRGGAGNDSLTGGGGNDAFYFTAGDGNDTIADFLSGADGIWLTGTNLHSFADVQSAATYNAATGATTIAYSGGTLTLAAITLAQLNANDFHFV